MAEKMKPSGIDWIGDIPNNWETSRIKYHYQISLGKMLQPIQENSTDTLEHYMCSANITWAGVDTSILKQMWFSPAEKKQYRLLDGDLLVSEGGDVAVSCIWRNELDECYLQNAVHRVRQNALSDNRFIYYWLFFLKNYGIVDLICNKATIAHFTKEKFGELPICIMSIDEQVAIADFLDKECAQIDGIAADLEKQIALLQQYKKSLITETVTKGLDKSVPMKDSGIEGVGKIPSHWKVNRLKYAAVVKTGPFGTQLSASEYSDEGIPVINVKNIGYGTIIEDDLDYVPDEVSQRLAHHQLQLGDIVFGRKGAVDKHAIITESQIGWVQGSDCIRVRIDGDIESRYLNYLFDTVYFAEYVLLYAVGATMASINSDILTNSKILVPPITEQRCIADFLDSNCKTLFEIIENKQSQLTTLQQHKKSLIYEYVTGKKRVKEVQ